jgi:hypothetical protein
MRIQNSRIKIKTSSTTGEVPTVAPSGDHTDGSWGALDIYKGELFINLVDGKVFSRDDSGIFEIITSNSGNYFEQGGNAFGATAVLGTTDSEDLVILSDNTERIRVQSDANGGNVLIYDINGVEVFNSSSAKTLRDDAGDVGLSVKWAARELWGASSVKLNWLTGILYKTGKKVLDWLNYLTYDIQENISMNFGSREGITSKYLLKGTTIEAFGDSFTQGSNASPSSNSYINLLATEVGATISNRSVSGRGVWQMASSANANIGINSTRPVTMLAGFNDYRRSGTNIKTDNKVYGCHMSVMASQFLKSYIDAQNFLVTKSANYTTAYAANTVGGKAAGVYNTGAGIETLDYTFEENNVVVQVIGNSGDVETFGTLKIYIDAVLQETISLNNLSDNISDGSNDNRRGPYVFVYTGLGAGSHTVTVEAQGDGLCPVDYFGHLNEPEDCKVACISTIPYMNVTGYAIAPANGSDAVFDQGSSIIESAYRFFYNLRYPVALVRVNDYYNIATGIDTDNIHPNNTGHAQIYDGFKAAIDIRETSFDWNKREITGTWVGVEGNQRKLINGQYVEFSTDYDGYIYEQDYEYTGTGGHTLTLYSPVGWKKTELTIINNGSGNLTVNGGTLTAGNSLKLISNGTIWI